MSSAVQNAIGVIYVYFALSAPIIAPVMALIAIMLTFPGVQVARSQGLRRSLRFFAPATVAVLIGALAVALLIQLQAGGGILRNLTF